jgi:glutathione S-transferase
MYQLYYMPGAASLVVHWLLIELDVPHELRRVDGAAKQQKSPEYLKLNPNGLVPTLVVDGQPVYECAALAMLLAERHPEKGFAPPPGHAKRGLYLQWMLHLANTVQPAFRIWWYPHEAAGPEHAEAAKALATQKIEAAWDRLDAHLAVQGPYILGEAPSAADFLATMLARWSRNMARPATDWPAFDALIRRMKARPSFATLYEREDLTEWG